MSLSILKRSDASALICLTAAPPNELAQRLSQGHPFRVTTVVTFPDAYWAEDLAARLAEKRVGDGGSDWFAVSPSDAILKILELWGAPAAPAKRPRDAEDSAPADDLADSGGAPDAAVETESVASEPSRGEPLTFLEACDAAFAPKAADLRAGLTLLHGAEVAAAVMAQCTQNNQLDDAGKRRRILRFRGHPMLLKA